MSRKKRREQKTIKIRKVWGLEPFHWALIAMLALSLGALGVYQFLVR